ncbi:uncharacterized protein LOC144705903 isoform X1 [Wolffia australiana]
MHRNMWRKALRESPPLHLRPALLHSTPIFCGKWKNKFHPKGETEEQRAPKNYIRYIVRQKRADTKRALRDLLNSRSSNPYCDEANRWHEETTPSNLEDCEAKNPSKSRQRRQTRRFKRHNSRKGTCSFGADDDHDDTEVFEARFGNKSYTWTFRSWRGVDPSNPFTGFEWRQGTDSDGNEKKSWDRDSDFEDELDQDDDDDMNNRDHLKRSNHVGTRSDRAALGLRATGPLNITDVKIAFRMAALKWHPDRHQGPSQPAAEEEFKRCLESYETLCEALSSEKGKEAER